MNKELELVNQIQDDTVKAIANSSKSFITVQSKVGTGKSMMIAKLLALNPDKFFLITTLSKGSLDAQLQASIKQYNVMYGASVNNYIVIGKDKLKSNTKVGVSDLKTQLLAVNKPLWWIKDEGHIQHNGTDSLEDIFEKIILFSGTIKGIPDFETDFSSTKVNKTIVVNDVLDKKNLREAVREKIRKFVDIKKQYKELNIPVNPALLIQVEKDENLEGCKGMIEREFPQLSSTIYSSKIKEYRMSELIDNQCTINVIIFQMTFTEGVDIKRACMLIQLRHVKSYALTTQVVGRCLRNPCLTTWDKLSKEQQELVLKCYVYTLIPYHHQKFKYIDSQYLKLGESFTCECCDVTCNSNKYEPQKFVAEFIIETGEYKDCKFLKKIWQRSAYITCKEYECTIEIDTHTRTKDFIIPDELEHKKKIDLTKVW